MRVDEILTRLRSTKMCRQLLCILFGAALAASSNAQARIGSDRDNAREQRKKPYVVLVGLDGFRSDYVDKYHATHLQTLGEHGVHASLTPVFPSSTFPNFYSIATGLYPEHHGIVDMHFYDPPKKRAFSFSNSHDSSDGSWYGGVPIWALAQRNGMRTANFFWVGSDAEIGGRRPSYYVPYDGKIPNEARAAQVIAWLKLPAAKRPHLIMVYFSDADEAGHRFGPDSGEMRDAVQRLDRVVGTLAAQLKELNLPVNLLVVSDHGMIPLKRTPIALTDYLGATDLPDRAKYVANNINLYADSPEQSERWYAALKDKDSRFQAYRRADVPKRLHYSSNPRIGDIVLICREPVVIVDRMPPASAVATFFETHNSSHGFDPELMPEMQGIFYGQGPNIKTGTRIEPVENIEIYPLVARILGLRMDGRVDATGQLVKVIYRR